MSVSTEFLVGVFGGTFDPIHNGHLAVAEQSAAALGLSRVLVIPSNEPPHRDQPRASAVERLVMVQAALQGRADMVASDIEVTRGGVSYTVDTLRRLQALEPEAELVVLLGSDAAEEFGTWHEREEAARLARYVVFNRAGTDTPALERLRQDGLPGSTQLLQVDSPDISASAIRAKLAAGLDVSSDVPPAVLDYIRAQHIYLSEEHG